eukprot:m.265796 g.265796  ORF g.265796 m.265796 type:complete len:83 (+) comp26758_c0_seq1:3641-3889(+)
MVKFDLRTLVVIHDDIRIFGCAPNSNIPNVVYSTLIPGSTLTWGSVFTAPPASEDLSHPQYARRFLSAGVMSQPAGYWVKMR